MQVIALGGEPAAGKTTFTKALFAGVPLKYGRLGLLRFMFNEELGLYLLGLYDFEKEHRFEGTDKLSMAVCKDAARFLSYLELHRTTSKAFFEGDRLFTSAFLNKCIEIAGPGNVHIYVLACFEEVLQARHAARQDTQDTTWLKGRKTKIRNITAEFRPIPIWNNNEKDFTEGLALVKKRLGLP